MGGGALIRIFYVSRNHILRRVDGMDVEEIQDGVLKFPKIPKIPNLKTKSMSTMILILILVGARVEIGLT